jgi:hypothetical protein
MKSRAFNAPQRRQVAGEKRSDEPHARSKTSSLAKPGRCLEGADHVTSPRFAQEELDLCYRYQDVARCLTVGGDLSLERVSDMAAHDHRPCC